jgi:hypothetical protein
LKIAIRPPGKVVFPFSFRGLLETVDAAALRIDAAHHRADRAVFSGRVGRLRDQQYGVKIRGVVEMPRLAELGHALLEQTLVLLRGFVNGIDLLRPLLEINSIALAHAKIL